MFTYEDMIKQDTYMVCETKEEYTALIAIARDHALKIDSMYITANPKIIKEYLKYGFNFNEGYQLSYSASMYKDRKRFTLLYMKDYVDEYTGYKEKTKTLLKG